MWIAIQNAIGARQGVGGGPGPGPGPGYTPPLDDYPNAAAAYSVRLLRTAYSGSALRVRRSVAPFDEQDIGFTAGGDLDEAAIVAFGGSDNLKVSAWYDQSGESNHATQITPGAQPQIYNGTSVITENGKPCIDYDSTGGDSFNMATSIEVVTSIHVIKGESGTGFEQYVLGASSGLDWYSNLGQLVNQNSAAGQNTTLHLDGASVNPYIARPTTQSLAFFNWTTGSGTTSQITQDRGTSSRSWKGTYQELILYTSDQSSNRTGIETNINDYYEVFVNDEAATSGFLFDYPNAAVAYSVRQLNNNAEFAMQVERSDGRTKNIGFDGNGDLDTQAIIDFAGASVATISQWYDQSGNQVHMAQNNPTLQPMIYDGASVITDNNKPCIEFLGASNLILQTANATPSLSQPTTYFVTANKPNHSSYLWDGISSRQAQGDQTWIFAGGLSYNFYPNSELGSQVLFTALFNGASSVGRINASQTATGNPGSNALGGIEILSKEGNKYQEFVVYGADQTSQFTPIESDIMTYFNIP